MYPQSKQVSREVRDTWKVYIQGIGPHVRERDITEKFRTYGVVRSVWMARNPPGYGFLELDNCWEADGGISALDDNDAVTSYSFA